MLVHTYIQIPNNLILGDDSYGIFTLPEGARVYDLSADFKDGDPVVSIWYEDGKGETKIHLGVSDGK